MTDRFYKTLLITCLLIFLIAFYFNSENTQDKEISHKISQHIERIHISNSISSYAKRAEGHLLLFLMLENKKDREKFFKRADKLYENTLLLEPLLNNSVLKNISIEIKQNHSLLVSNTIIILKKYDAATGKEKPNFLKNNNKLIHDIHSYSSNIRKLGVQIVKLSTEYLQTEKEEINAKNAVKYRSLGIFTFVTFLFLIVITYQSGKLEASKKMTDSLEKISYLDSLTSVGNRRLFDKVYSEEWLRAIRSKKALSLLFIDIDYFKNYNDTYGHANGDNCLVRVTQTLKGCLKRPTDTLARYGGEEFVIILPETNDPHHIAENCRTAIENLKIPNIGTHSSEYITISIGLGIIIPTNDSSAEKFIKHVDNALYLAKNEGRNCIRDYVQTI